MGKERCTLLVIGIVCLGLLFPAYAGAADKDVIKLKFSAWTAPRGPFAKTCSTYLDRIEKRTNGKVKFERYWSGTLVPAKEEVQGIGKGIAEIAVVYAPFQTRLSLIDVVELPGLGATLDKQGPIGAEIGKMKAVKDQFDQYNLLFVSVNGGEPAHLISKKPVRTIDDLKGMKIRCVGDAAKMMQMLGAVPVALTSSECYEAMERGVTDGIIMPTLGMYVWKLHEVGRYYTTLNAYCGFFYFIMNKDSWNALPEDVKKVFEQVGKEQIDNYINIYKETYAKAFADFDKEGVERIDLSPADRKKITQVSRSLWDGWVKKQEKKGLPGQKVLDKCLELNGIK